MKMNRFTILSLLLVSILTVASTMAVAGDDPLSVLLNYNDQRARGHLDAALAFVADDAIWDGGGGCWDSPCIGKEAIRKSMQLRFKAEGRGTITATYTQGSVVTQRYEVRPKQAGEAGVERLVHWRITEVKDGKIVAQRILRERTDPQTARYIKWRQEQTRASAR